MMNRKWLLSVGFGLAFGTAGMPAIAQDFPVGMKNPGTAEGLVQACQTMAGILSQDTGYEQTIPDVSVAGIQTGYCMGYLYGYRDLARAIRSASTIQLACIPKDVSVIDMAKTLADALAAFPKWGNAQADGFMFAAFEAKWPCKKEKSS